MMKYKILLFDVDDTLLDFKMNERQSLEKVFRKNDIICTEEILDIYKKINDNLWSEFNKGNIEKQYIINNRFPMLFNKLNMNVNVDRFKEDYQYELGHGYQVIDGAKEICEKLSHKCDIYCVTNGLAEHQFRRIKGAGLDKYFKDIFVSEEVGFQKPKKEYFDYVAKKISNFNVKSSLIIGDSLESDIQGGINAGIDTCWFNPNKLANIYENKPTYEICKLSDLLDIIGYNAN